MIAPGLGVQKVRQVTLKIARDALRQAPSER